MEFAKQADNGPCAELFRAPQDVEPSATSTTANDSSDMRRKYTLASGISPAKYVSES